MFLAVDMDLLFELHSEGAGSKKNKTRKPRLVGDVERPPDHVRIAAQPLPTRGK